MNLCTKGQECRNLKCPDTHQILSDEAIRAAAIRIADANGAALRERVLMMAYQNHGNTAALLQEVDRIVKYIQTGDTKA